MATILDIKKAICTLINTNISGAVAIVTPTDNPAPKGCYIAVRDLDVRQFGRPLKSKPGNTANEKDTVFCNVAELIITEVEGEGELIRNVRNLFQLNTFRDSLYAMGFSLWNISDIANKDMFDGEILIKQKSFTMQVNFADKVKNSALKALSASVEVIGEKIEANL